MRKLITPPGRSSRPHSRRIAWICRGGICSRVLVDVMQSIEPSGSPVPAASEGALQVLRVKVQVTLGERDDGPAVPVARREALRQVSLKEVIETLPERQVRDGELQRRFVLPIHRARYPNVSLGIPGRSSAGRT